ncbi:MAG TPA: hypothetical protein EYQ12_03840, partial [Oceanospirillaceae bacterium]|nr:hypothetical protein [Oceanospirillaceae bacterium]
YKAAKGAWTANKPLAAEANTFMKNNPGLKNGGSNPSKVAKGSERFYKALKASQCKRAILVGHNATFDLNFINAAAQRCHQKRNPFHPFSCFDTATLAGLAYGQTVLAKACAAADIRFSNEDAHSARYDAEKTAELFCTIVNRWKQLGGWQAEDDEFPFAGLD